MKENKNISSRSFVIEMSVKIEYALNLIIAKLLGINPESSKSFGASSQALSFNAKANLLLDLNKLNKQDREKFQIFMEIRNKFAHLYEVDSFVKCFEFTKNYNRIKKIYEIDEDGESLEEDMETMFSILSMDISQILKEIKDQIYKDMAIRYTQRKFTKAIKEKRKVYKSKKPENAKAVDDFIDFIKNGLLKEVDEKIENKIPPHI